MKTIKVTFDVAGSSLTVALTLCFCAPFLFAQTNTTLRPGPKILEEQVLVRTLHEEQVRRVTQLTNRQGQAFTVTNRVHILSPGLNYRDDTGQLRPSRAEFLATDQGFAALEMGHKVRLARNLNGAGSVSITTPDGQLLRGHPLCLAYSDDTGKRVVIAELKDCQGELVASNVVALVDANGQVAAEYAYGPFGEFLRATGPLAFVNPFRFSTTYQDDETGLMYYGHRYHSAQLCRWLSREPLAEAGSANLYAFCFNDPLNIVDVLGLGPHWTDDVAQKYNAQAQQAKDITIESQGWFMAGIINSFIDVGSGFVNLLPATAHLGEATGATGQIGNEALLQPVSNFGTGFGKLSVSVNVESIQESGQDLLVVSALGKPTKPFAAYNEPINLVNQAVKKIPNAPAALTQLAPGFKPVDLPGPLDKPIQSLNFLDKPIPGKLFNTPVQELFRGNCTTVKATPGLPAKVPLDLFKYAKHPTSRVLCPSVKDGTYVFVQDIRGTVHIADNGPHMHPQILGNATAVASAGEIVIQNGIVVEINNLSGTFKPAASTLIGVQNAIESQGLTVASDAIKPFVWPE